MTVRRIVAPTAREALRQVKELLGEDAVIIANKPVEGGVEITAMSADGLDALSSVPERVAPPARPVSPAGTGRFEEVDDDYTVSLSGKAKSSSPFRVWQPVSSQPVPNPVPATESRPKLRPLPPREPSIPEAALRQPAPDFSEPSFASSPRFDGYANTLDKGTTLGGRQVEQLVSEMQTIKELLERQLAGFAWGELSRGSPARATLLGELLDSGFSSALARRMVDALPKDMSPNDGRKWLASALNRHLRTLSGENDLIDQGGVFALVGPTGVGKTTTTAKLAARCVVRYGAERMALLTTDGYRIGAHEQLRIYGRILGVPVHVVRDSEDLRRTLMELRDKHMILIDTVGMSQRDRMVAEQAAMLTRAGEVKRLLLLNAGSRGDTLDDVIRAYSGEDIAGCILTKVDEAASLGPALDAVVRHGLLLAYVANGQRVPEDMHLPNRNYLLHRAFKLPADSSPHRLRPDEVGLMSACATASSTAQGVRLG